MFDHYIALDWAQSNMAIARMTQTSGAIETKEGPSSIKELKLYLSQLRGKKILTFEETTPAQWLYTELRDYVDEILVCDPYRNYLLSEGPKTDRLDACKLVQLLRSGLLKKVFHSGDEFMELRKLVSGYQDVVKMGVRFKNQRAALLRTKGKAKKEQGMNGRIEQFVLEGIDDFIQFYEARKSRYEQEMAKLRKQHPMIRWMEQLPGIGLIGAVKIVAIVVDPRRFKEKGRWLSYLGLVKHEKLSGGRSYGKRDGRYCRVLKSVFKTAALSVIQHETQNDFKSYYEFLLREKKYSEPNARHALARRIAIVALGVLKSQKPYQPKRRLEAVSV